MWAGRCDLNTHEQVVQNVEEPHPVGIPIDLWGNTVGTGSIRFCNKFNHILVIELPDRKEGPTRQLPTIPVQTFKSELLIIINNVKIQPVRNRELCHLNSLLIKDLGGVGAPV